MSRRTKPPVSGASQRLPGRHDIPAARAHQRAKSRPALHVTSTASSRAKQHTSLRMGGPLTSSTKDLTKSTSMIQANRSKTEHSRKPAPPPRKVPTEAESFYTNLLLLGFNPDEVSAKHRGSSVVFDKDMFNVPNMLAFQVVMHFLFNKLDSVKFHDDFRDCWPICDRKQEQAFRKACLAWLTDIGEKEEAHLPRLVPSLLLSPGGARFYQLMLSLSTYILQKLLDPKQQRLKIQYPLITPKNVHMTELIARTMKEAVARRRANFMANVQQSIIVNRECEQFANDLVKEYRSLNEEIRAKERALKELRAELTPSKTPLSPRGLDSVSAARRERLSTIRAKWQRLATYYDRSRKERDVVSSIISGTIDRHRILGSEYNVHVPDLLLRTRNEEIQRLKLGNTYESGKLNLITVVRLWTLSMGICLEKTGFNKPPNLSHFAPNLLRHVHDIAAYLANLRSLKNKIGTLDIPDVRKCINELRFGTETPRKMWNNSKDSLGFVPPTPPVSFEPASPYVAVLPYIKGKTPPQVGSTPEAAMRIMQSVQKRSRRQKEPDAISRLPTRKECMEDDTILESLIPESGPIARFRQHSGPGGSGRISTPTRPRTGPQFTSGGRKPEPQSKPILSTHKMPLLKPSLNSRVLDHLQTVQVTNDNHTRPVIKTRNTVTNKPQDTSRSNVNVTKTSSVMTSKIPMTSQNKRSVSKELFSFSPPKSSKERAEDELIDQLVNAITSTDNGDKMSISATSSPEELSAMDVNIADPLPALDDAPFQKRDKIANSPPCANVGLGTSPVLRSRKTVQFSPGTRVEVDPQRSRTPENDLDHSTNNVITEMRMKTPTLDDVRRQQRYDAVKSPDVVRHFSPADRQSPVTRVYLSPLPEFTSPIQLASSESSNHYSDEITVHEPSPARLQARIRVPDLAQSPYNKSPMMNVPVLDLAAVSPTGDVMDASLELVDMSSSSSDEDNDGNTSSQRGELVVPTGNLLGFVARDPSPSCITPCKADAARLLADNEEDERLVIGQLSPEAGRGEPSAAPSLNFDEHGNFSNSYNGRGDTNLTPSKTTPGGPSIQDEVLLDNLIDFEPQVLNSEQKIEMVYEAERTFEEDMINLSLKVTGTPQYGKSPKNVLNTSSRKDASYGASTSILGMDDENDVIGIPRTPMDFHVQNDVTKADTPMRIPFTISPNFQFNESPSPENLAANVDAAQVTSPGFTASPQLTSNVTAVPSPSQKNKTSSQETDILSRFRSLKLRSQQLPRSRSPVVLTPDEDAPPTLATNHDMDDCLDSVYLQQSPRRESNDAAKFVLDLDDFDLEDAETNQNEDVNNNSMNLEDDDSEVGFRSPEKVVEQLTTPAKPLTNNLPKSRFTASSQIATPGLANLSGLLDMDTDTDDILVPGSPTGGGDFLI